MLPSKLILLLPLIHLRLLRSRLRRRLPGVSAAAAAVCCCLLRRQLPLPFCNVSYFDLFFSVFFFVFFIVVFTGSPPDAHPISSVLPDRPLVRILRARAVLIREDDAIVGVASPAPIQRLRRPGWNQVHGCRTQLFRVSKNPRDSFHRCRYLKTSHYLFDPPTDPFLFLEFLDPPAVVKDPLQITFGTTEPTRVFIYCGVQQLDKLACSSRLL